MILQASPRLGALARSRDNNLNLIRFLAATAVLVSHAWPITGGPEIAEPLQDLAGRSLGSMAVYVFFAVSGFLVTASFSRSRSARAFVSARAWRLFPGLLVSLLLVTFVLGPAVTSLPLASYLTHPDTLTFLLRNITLVAPQYNLPGVFTTNPYSAVEGSIWTLIHEVLCYCVVFLAGVIGLLWRPRAMMLAFASLLALWLVLAAVPLAAPARLMDTHRLALPFLVGMGFWLYRDHLPLSLGAALALLSAAALARAIGLQAAMYDILLVFALSYATLWTAYVPSGKLRAFNRIGDYSYGIYIYAFPAQGLMVWLAGPQSAATNITLALPVTLICAALSWHLVEAPALRRKVL